MWGTRMFNPASIPPPTTELHITGKFIVLIMSTNNVVESCFGNDAEKVKRAATFVPQLFCPRMMWTLDPFGSCVPTSPPDMRGCLGQDPFYDTYH